MTPKVHFCASVVNKHIVLLTRQTDKQSRKQGKRVRSQRQSSNATNPEGKGEHRDLQAGMCPKTGSQSCLESCAAGTGKLGRDQDRAEETQTRYD